MAKPLPDTEYMIIDIITARWHLWDMPAMRWALTDTTRSRLDLDPMRKWYVWNKQPDNGFFITYYNLAALPKRQIKDVAIRVYYDAMSHMVLKVDKTLPLRAEFFSNFSLI